MEGMFILYIMFSKWMIEALHHQVGSVVSPRVFSPGIEFLTLEISRESQTRKLAAANRRCQKVGMPLVQEGFNRRKSPDVPFRGNRRT